MLQIDSKKAQAQGAAARGVQFLSPKHILNRNDGEVFEILKVTTDKPDNFNNPYVVFFSKGGEKFSKGFKPTSEGLAQLASFLGADEKKWSGVEVNINVLVDEDDGERLTYKSAGKEKVAPKSKL